MENKDRKEPAKQKRYGALRILLFIFLIVFMANLNAMVDLYLHPDIPYFDHEHLIVGGAVGMFSLILGVIIFLYIGRLREISEERRKLLINLSEAKEKAEESERLKSAFLANMSHEIRTPLNGILGFAGLLEGPNLSAEEQQEFLKIVQISGERMLNIINEIIDISKIESGAVKLRLSEVNVNEKLDTVFNFLSQLANEKGLKFTVEKGLPNEDSVIEIDKDKLNSVLVHLVRNGIKYTNEGSVEFGYKFLTTNGSEVLERDNNVLEFYVKDSGIGIEVSRQKAIFDRFVQADIYDIEARQGAGLGLSITKAYVEMLGGEIWVKSIPGKGSSFHFTVPYIKPQAKKEFKSDDF